MFLTDHQCSFLLSRSYCAALSRVFPQPTFLVELSKVLANPGNTQVARVAAGLQVKNSLTSKDPDVKTQYQQRWLAIDASFRCEIKNYVRDLSPLWLAFHFASVAL